MASFCSNCGAALSEGAPFCLQCGARVGQAAPPPPNAPAPAPLAPAAKSPLVKILFIVLVVFLLLGAIGVAGAIYVGYKVKDKVERVAKEYGVDNSTPAGPAARRADPCSFVSKEEAGDIMGLTIERAESSGDQTCTYFAQALTDEERDRQVAKLKEMAENSGVRIADPKKAEEFAKGMIGAMTGAAGAQFSIKFDWEGGRAAIAAMKLAAGALGPDIKTTESLTGIGDEAVLGPMGSMLLFRKGATAVEIDMRTALKDKAQSVALAKLVAGRLSF